ncbi:MAG: S4 domain-containing protein, partial [Oceanibaculum sp.]
MEEVPVKEGAKEGERIAKRIARAGVCSRRDAEKLIAERRVSVDGHVIDTPATSSTSTHLIDGDGGQLPAASASASQAQMIKSSRKLHYYIASPM